MTDVFRLSAWVLAGTLVALAPACEDEKEPDVIDTGTPAPLAVQSVISDPKVGLPGDTLLFTVVITSSSPNLGDYPEVLWTATGGEFLENGEQSVRWVAPITPGLFTVTARASNDVNSDTGETTLYVGAGQTLMETNGGQVDLIGVGPDFNYLRTTGPAALTRTFQYIGGVSSDPIPPHIPSTGLQQSTVYFPDGSGNAYAADTLQFATTVRARHIYVGTFAAGTYQRLTVDQSRPGNSERNVCAYPSISPNTQVIAYQRWAQSWDGIATDSFHVYIHDLPASKRTLVTYEHEFPRGFFPTFSTDGNWLVYVVDRSRNGTWDIYASPMSGNDVDGSLASLKRLTNTGGNIVTGAPKDIRKPPMLWNPVSPVLAVIAADNGLYLMDPNAAGVVSTPVEEVTRPQEMIWAPNGSMLAASYSFVDADDDTRFKLVTITTGGAVTDRVISAPGDNFRDMVFSPDGNWLLYRVTRGGGAWFSVVDLTGTKLTVPVPVTATDPAGVSGAYRNIILLRPAWTSTNLLIYPSFANSSNQTPGIFSRDLNGLLN